jgi:hypothetical protein
MIDCSSLTFLCFFGVCTRMHQSVGMLVCWFVGLLGCWVVGLLGCWVVGFLYLAGTSG